MQVFWVWTKNNLKDWGQKHIFRNLYLDGFRLRFSMIIF